MRWQNFQTYSINGGYFPAICRVCLWLEVYISRLGLLVLLRWFVGLTFDQVFRLSRKALSSSFTAHLSLSIRFTKVVWDIFKVWRGLQPCTSCVPLSPRLFTLIPPLNMRTPFLDWVKSSLLICIYLLTKVIAQQLFECNSLDFSGVCFNLRIFLSSNASYTLMSSYVIPALWPQLLYM